MDKYVWHNPYLPQTLQTAEVLLYIQGVFGLLFNLSNVSLTLLAVTGAYILAAFGIANLKWWGIILGVIAVSIFWALYFILNLIDGESIFELIGNIFSSGNQIIGFLITVAIVCLLLHPMSLNYAKRNFSKKLL